MRIDGPDEQFVPIDSITPYEGNPRRIPQDAIEAVAESIERYGWQQPIVVDKNNVIVVGHTRHLAAKHLGLTEVPVHVTDLPEDKVREYRLVDNRTGEMTAWDHSALVMELREFESTLLERFFPDVDLEVDQVKGAAEVTDEEVAVAEVNAATIPEPPKDSRIMTGVHCPSCYTRFEVKTSTLPGVTPALLAELMEHGEA